MLFARQITTRDIQRANFDAHRCELQSLARRVKRHGYATLSRYEQRRYSWLRAAVPALKRDLH